MSREAKNPRKGEIWYVRFDPRIGSEYEKTRPAVVINEDFVGQIPLRIVVPVTTWKPKHQGWPWMTPLRATQMTGLKKRSSADSLQVKSVSIQRFQDRIGCVGLSELEQILSAVILSIGYECPMCRARDKGKTS